MSLWEMESASRTGKPNSRRIAATTLLPLAMPPVRPSFSIESRNSFNRAACPTITNFQSGILGTRDCGAGGATEAGGFHRVAHQHGDGHRADAAGDGR